ncbi:hypothetical protein [Mesorhizobium waimense]|uniref:hypothetical protein n=1 Tax=Mesorhizobium waimense TaxID=1300307 RepID=UPI0011C47380|nr:hypothetical protein [Mesorhizobium waimense]
MNDSKIGPVSLRHSQTARPTRDAKWRIANTAICQATLHDGFIVEEDVEAVAIEGRSQVEPPAPNDLELL